MHTFPTSLDYEHNRLKAARQLAQIPVDAMAKQTGLDIVGIEAGLVDVTREIRHDYQVAICQRRRGSRNVL